MLLESFKIVQVMPCLADPAKIRVVASLSDKVDEVFPYLNATMKNIGYVPVSDMITMKKEHRLITVYPHRVSIAKADDEGDAKATLRWLQDMINQTWEKRDQIVPSYESHQVLRPLDAYGLLPKTNCKQCGEMTCLAFAVALLQGSRSVDDCPPLNATEWSASRGRLAEVLSIDGILKT